MYNFLSDSFKYNRIDDVGYLIARILINKEEHYFVEGKRQVGTFYSNFNKSVLNQSAMQNIIDSAINYCLDFDLLVHPYDMVKEVSVQEMQTVIQSLRLKTGKRLGFRFQADHEKKKN